jgi:hypothetical protein
MRPTSTHACSLMLCTVVAACSGSNASPGGGRGNDGGPSPGMTGMANRGDDAGDVFGAPSDGGVAGADGTPGSSDGGDAGPADSGPATALDPSLPTPSHDCRTDTTSPNCISAAGFYDGKPIDAFCNDPDGTDVTIHAGKWVIGCDDANPLLAELDVPIQEPGPFSETDTPDASVGMEFEFSDDTMTTVALFAQNLVRVDLQGSVTGGSSRTVSGTLHGEWSTVLDGGFCQSLSGSACGSAEINVTFRLVSEYGTCLSDADCTAPKTCAGVSYDCECPSDMPFCD